MKNKEWVRKLIQVEYKYEINDNQFYIITNIEGYKYTKYRLIFMYDFLKKKSLDIMDSFNEEHLKILALKHYEKVIKNPNKNKIIWLNSDILNYYYGFSDKSEHYYDITFTSDKNEYTLWFNKDTITGDSNDEILMYDSDLEILMDFAEEHFNQLQENKRKTLLGTIVDIDFTSEEWKKAEKLLEENRKAMLNNNKNPNVFGQ